MRFDLEYEAQKTAERLLPRIERDLSKEIKGKEKHWKILKKRLADNFYRLFKTLYTLYGQRYDFCLHLEDLLAKTLQQALLRPEALKKMDYQREKNPEWFLSNEQVGGVCYVDLFAGNLKGIREKIPYFKKLGLTYLHLMPLFKCPEDENDGGYAVSCYRNVESCLGNFDELVELAKELRANGISLVLDFVFNHSSDQHEWAIKAKNGDTEYQNYYLLFDNEAEFAPFQANLRDIFPDVRKGSFTWEPQMKQWVWTTFNSYQWDLNYSNPAVFSAMLGEMLFLANAGVEILRLDAVAFIWKEPGSGCENLPQAHLLIQAFNALLNIAAPGVLFKSEAIVHPDEVLRYISPQECQLSYNPLLMACLWNSLATREVGLLRESLLHRYNTESGTLWINYLRCHDDIGWSFDDHDAARLGINAFDHRLFLNDFYTGRFPGSFACGLPFQFNPVTRDCRISGTLASLAGLEKAIHEQNEEETVLAIKKILLLHSVILSAGGMPLIYLGDEFGQLNDYNYRKVKGKAGDSRWVHRVAIDWQKTEKELQDEDSVAAQIFNGLQKLIQLRKERSELSGNNTDFFDCANPHVLSFLRTNEGKTILLLHNFSERPQRVNANELRIAANSSDFINLITKEKIKLKDEIILESYQFLWLGC
jgi:amylosucrase